MNIKCTQSNYYQLKHNPKSTDRCYVKSYQEQEIRKERKGQNYILITKNWGAR